MNYLLDSKQLYSLYNSYNKKYFNNILPKCKLSVYNDNSQFGRYTFCHIWIVKNVEWSEETLKEVLIHEMIHHYVVTIEHKNGGIFGHNWRFKRQCKRIYKEHGLKIHVFAPKGLYHIKEKIPKTYLGKLRRFFGI